jgi:hypothetical protein
MIPMPIRSPSASVCAITVAALAIVACTTSRAPDPRYPPRVAGCAVIAFEKLPERHVNDLGRVSVDCADGVDSACTRKLMDAVCEVGGNVAWDLRTDDQGGGIRYAARAAHTTSRSSDDCAVHVFAAEAPGPVDELTNVVVDCTSTEVECRHDFERTACMLGADVAWGLGDPYRADGLIKLSGHVGRAKAKTP